MPTASQCLETQAYSSSFLSLRCAGMGSLSCSHTADCGTSSTQILGEVESFRPAFAHFPSLAAPSSRSEC